MSNICHILATDSIPPTPESGACSILCLGTGKGATALLHAEPSSSFAIIKDGKPLLLVDLGLGVTTSIRQNLTKELDFDKIYITHNHADHAAELPVLLAILCHKRKHDGSVCKPTILAAPEVMQRILAHRMNEITCENLEKDLAEWQICEPFPKRTPIDAKGVYEISTLKSQHSEICYGFILYENGEPLLGFTGDSGFNSELFDQLFSATNIIIDAREKSSKEHAGFAEVQNYLNAHQGDRTVFITGYGIDSEFNEDAMKGIVKMRTSQEYMLQKYNKKTNTTADYMSTFDAARLHR